MSDKHMELQIIYRDKHGRSIERHSYINPRPAFLCACVEVAHAAAIDDLTHPLVKAFSIHYEPSGGE